MKPTDGLSMPCRERRSSWIPGPPSTYIRVEPAGGLDLIIPIGHERDTVRRLPWVTFGIMIACALMLILSDTGTLDGGDGGRSAESAAEYFFEHPYLELDPKFEKLLYQAFPYQDTEAVVSAMRSEFPPPDDREFLEQEQEELNRLTTTALRQLNRNGYRRFGLVPGDQSLLGWITHMFMHAGLLHLLGNLLILYLAGPFIEDVWGRPLFLLFYLASGLFAAGAFMIRDPGAMVPLVGASGAIAGVMGAFLIRYWNTQIRFFYFFGIVFRGTFDAPAWTMLPLWFCEQLAMALATDTGAGSGVAYWAHVGGFLFGVGIAALVAKYDIEKRYLDRKLTEKIETAVISNPVVEQALAAREKGDLAGAYALLSTRVQSGPASGDASLALWSLAGELGRTVEAAPALLALVEMELRSGEQELAAEHWMELREQVPDLPVSAEILIRIGKELIRAEHTDEGLAALRQALLQGGAGMSPSTALRIARAAEAVDPDLARGAARMALCHPDIQAAERSQALALTEVHKA